MSVCVVQVYDQVPGKMRKIGEIIVSVSIVQIIMSKELFLTDGGQPSTAQ